MDRAQTLDEMCRLPLHDLLVVGGGATGMATALEAAWQGYRVALVDARDFAAGTSSRSTKLLHGGVRYLAQGEWSLIRQALQERASLMAMAPHLAQPLSFVLPAYNPLTGLAHGAGLKLYAALAGRHSLGPTQWMGRAATAQAVPGWKTTGLSGGVLYWDGQFEDARMVLAMAKTLRQMGSHAVNYVQAHRITRSTEAGAPHFKAVLTDNLSGRQHTLRAQAVVNATGVWVDELRAERAAPTSTRLINASQGVHLVLARERLPLKHAVLMPDTADGRVLFAIPWLGRTLLGTTDTPTQHLSFEPQALPAEIDFILKEASRHLQWPLQRSDVSSVWVGLRPLAASGDEHDTARLSREHRVVVDPDGLVTVIGGKWTTCRVMARDALQACLDAAVLPQRPRIDTSAFRLWGVPDPETRVRSLQDDPGLHLYGAEQNAVLDCPGADTNLAVGLNLAMVRYAARQEWAIKVEDVLARRHRLLYLDAAQAQRIAPMVAACLQEETGLDPDLTGFMQLAQHHQVSA